MLTKLNLRIIVFFLFLFIILSGCVPVTAIFGTESPGSISIEGPGITSGNPAVTPSAQPDGIPSSTLLPVDIPGAAQVAMNDLAGKLGIRVDQIQLASIDAVNWPDGCLGVQQIGVMCAKGPVPGFRVVLLSNGMQYEYHTNQDATAIIQSPPNDNSDVLSTVIQDLSQATGVPQDQIQVIINAPVEWPDSCLGIAQTDSNCTQVITPGYLIVLKEGGVQYEYHTDQEGAHFEVVKPN